MIDYPNTLELVGDDLARYHEIRRMRRYFDPSGETPVALDQKTKRISRGNVRVTGIHNEVQAKAVRTSRTASQEVTPRNLELYARIVCGAPEETSWLTPTQWELVILFCHERLSVSEAAARCRLSEDGIRFRWKRTRRRIQRFSSIGSIVDVDRRKLNLGV